MIAPELELAATVTRGAVRCSAWLGDVDFIELAIAQLQQKKCYVAGNNKQERVEKCRPSVLLLTLPTGCVPCEQTNHTCNGPNKKHGEENDMECKITDARLQEES